MATMLAKGKAKVGYVLPEKLIERVRTRAAKRRVITSHMAEKLLVIGLEHEAATEKPEPEPEPAAAN